MNRRGSAMTGGAESSASRGGRARSTRLPAGPAARAGRTGRARPNGPGCWRSTRRDRADAQRVPGVLPRRRRAGPAAVLRHVPAGPVPRLAARNPRARPHPGATGRPGVPGGQYACVTVIVMFVQEFARLVNALFSALSTLSRHRVFTATHSPTYRHFSLVRLPGGRVLVALGLVDVVGHRDQRAGVAEVVGEGLPLRRWSSSGRRSPTPRRAGPCGRCRGRTGRSRYAPS